MARTRPENRDGSGDAQSPRAGNGRFAPGTSGNPGGRPRDTEHVAELARVHTAEAMETLVRLMRDGEERVQAQAAMAILDRGWGKPKETVAIDHAAKRHAQQRRQAEMMQELRRDPAYEAALLVVAEAQAKYASRARVDVQGDF